MRICNCIGQIGQMCLLRHASIGIGLLKIDSCTMMGFVRDICTSLDFSDKHLYNNFVFLWLKIVDSSDKQSKMISTTLTADFVAE